MPDRASKAELVQRNPHLAGVAERTPAAPKEESDDEKCPAFHYLRGLREKAQAIEFRLRNGNSIWLPYSLLGAWEHHPGVGLLLKFMGDIITLVLIRGSNLDAVLAGKEVNLTDRGLQRHRIVCVTEMDEAELRRVGEQGPTIDRIEIGEFESHADMRAWLHQRAPSFVRPSR